MPGPCICSGLSVANCLRQLCPLGTRSLSAQASVCGSPFGAVLDLGSLRSPAGKRLLLPILTAGLATSRASKRASYLQRSCALLCSPFSAVKMGGPFSLRCLSPLCSAAVGAGQTQMAVLGIVSCYVGGLAASMGRPVFQFAVGVNHIQIMLVGRFDVTWIFLQGKRPA